MKATNYQLLPERKSVLGLVSALVLMGVAHGAFAGVSCTSGPNPAVFSTTAPSGTFTVAPDVPVGTLLTPWTTWQGPGYSWECNPEKGVWTGVTLQSPMAGTIVDVPSEPTSVVGQTTYYALATSLPGVGLIAQHTSGTMEKSHTNPNGELIAQLYSTWWASSAIAWQEPLSVKFQYAIRYAFVKTGPMVGGAATISGQIARVGVDASPYNNPSNIASVNIAGGASFIVPTCTTPNVTINLGKHTDSDFPYIGSRRGYSGSYNDFNIDLTRCFTHTNSVSYSLRPLNGEVAGVPGMINLTPSSTAGGVRIRITDRSDVGVAFNAMTPLVLASNYRYVPLRASMERVGNSTFTPGSVQGQVEFTMAYN